MDLEPGQAVIKYTLQDDIAVITMDDGRMNVVNPAFVTQMYAALDRAETDQAKAVVLTGRADVFSAGFDLKEFQKGPEAARAQVLAGFEMLVRLLNFPRPLIAACTGHGIGMGVFLLMASDYRVGIEGAYKYSMPESRIGLDLGPLLIALAKSRISPKYFTRMAVLSEDLDVATATDAGVLDEVVAADALPKRSEEIAAHLSSMPAIFAKNKREIKSAEITAMRTALEAKQD